MISKKQQKAAMEKLTKKQKTLAQQLRNDRKNQAILFSAILNDAETTDNIAKVLRYRLSQDENSKKVTADEFRNLSKKEDMILFDDVDAKCKGMFSCKANKLVWHYCFEEEL